MRAHLSQSNVRVTVCRERPASAATSATVYGCSSILPAVSVLTLESPLENHAMKLTRKINVADRVFTVPDLKRLAKILDEQPSRPPSLEFTTEYEVKFEDEHRITGTADEVLSEEELNRPSRPITIEMRLRCYPADRDIRVDLSAGNWSYGNAIVVSGDDGQWVNATHRSLEDAVQKVAPQASFWRKHDFLLWLVIGAGVCCLMDIARKLLAFSITKAFPVAAKQNASALLRGLVYGPTSPGGWIWFCGFGLSLALPLSFWLLSAWPRVEFNFGNIYFRPDNRRRKFITVWTLVIVPVLIEVGLEAVRAALR